MAGKVLTAEKREQRLDQATADYIRGRLTQKAYDRAEREYAPNFLVAVRALTRGSDSRDSKRSPKRA